MYIQTIKNYLLQLNTFLKKRQRDEWKCLPRRYTNDQQHMKGSTSLVTKEIKFKPTTRHHFTPIWMATIQKMGNGRCRQGCRTTAAPHCERGTGGASVQTVWPIRKGRHVNLQLHSQAYTPEKGKHVSTTTLYRNVPISIIHNSSKVKTIEYLLIDE